MPQCLSSRAEQGLFLGRLFFFFRLVLVRIIRILGLILVIILILVILGNGLIHLACDDLPDFVDKADGHEGK